MEAGLTRALANAFEVSPSALTIPGIDADIGLMHTLFALEDLRGLTIGKLDGEITRGGLRPLAVHLHRDESTADKRPAGCLADSRHRYRSPIDSKKPLPTHLSVRALLIWTCCRRAARGNHSGPACHLHGRMFHPHRDVMKPPNQYKWQREK